MTEASLFEAKTKLSALVSQVEREGTEIVITRHGRPVARLVPYVSDAQAQREAAVLAELQLAAHTAGIRYSYDQLTEPLPSDDWGVFAEPLPPTRVADGP